MLSPKEVTRSPSINCDLEVSKCTGQLESVSQSDQYGAVAIK